ncbi:DNA/RNA non-specific endonuclease [Primorskyibacter aestuariivivens]|uniref:DNA/RNA non-specific endonuclease n=1 Tax=Primorskyibacter aestuariivivens TaxID=1888912 RepID=UPI00230151CF|nr:DNA/RNA non-specific endonuclease [Primorskyibacter aestuariivivens]MDA7428027.1 DNA/RNA non-specific endonuclease [Primorskyibacter aestuariivivens]
MDDFSSIHADSRALAHLIDIFLFKGAPKNTDSNHPVQILVNHGYAVGYAPSRLQPLWSAYRVAKADNTADFDRPHLYYADTRLPDTERLDNSTFGSLNGVSYDVGHMVPNEVINVQFGRLAQMETFFMSNMCPQARGLNRGAWLRLENAIRDIEDMPGQRDHVWAIVGPVFGDNPALITRSDGKQVPIADAFFCITIDPHRYPWDRPGNQTIACFMIPQDVAAGAPLTDFLVDLEDVEAATGLRFMPGWQSAPRTVLRAPGVGGRTAAPPPAPNRLLAALARETG